MSVLKEVRSDIGAVDLFEIFNMDTVKSRRGIGSREEIIEGFREVSALPPGDWLKRLIEESGKGIKIPVVWVDRGHYDNGTIALSGSTRWGWKGTLQHELGHAFEDWVFGLIMAEHLFYNRRSEQLYADNAPQPRIVTRSGNFPQKGIDLLLSDAYADVFYTGGRHDGFHEVFTMSIERLLAGELDALPPEQARFALGVLVLL